MSMARPHTDKFGVPAGDCKFTGLAGNSGVGASSLLFRDEGTWRGRPQPISLPNGHTASVLLSRWSDLANDQTREFTSDDEYEDHVLTLRLRRLKGELFIGGRNVWSGSTGPGQLFITGPKQSKWNAVIHGKYDHLRIFFPQPLLRECYEDLLGRPPPEQICLFETAAVGDEALAQIASTFQAAYSQGGAVALGLIDALGVAFASRLLAVHYHAPAPSGRRLLSRANSGLKLLLDYIEAHLDTPLYLSQLSEIAGVSRFQLSRQFREATGLAPYAYILHRRIARAKDLLSAPATGIAAIALEVGFSSQAHLTEAFRKEVGMTPGEWRKASS